MERFISDFFDDWLADAKRAEERKRKSETTLEEEAAMFRGLGQGNKEADDEAMGQWIDLVNQLNDGLEGGDRDVVTPPRTTEEEEGE